MTLTPPTRSERFDHLVRDFDTAMLVTHTPDGGLRARPMAVAAVDAGGDLWFSTGMHSGKTGELVVDDHVAVVLQDGRRFVSVSGRARVVVDVARARELWRESWRPFFPGGPTDPELVLVHVHASEAELWDRRGLRGLLFLFGAVRRALAGNAATTAPWLDGEKLDLEARQSSEGRARRTPTLGGWLRSQLVLTAKRAKPTG